NPTGESADEIISRIEWDIEAQRALTFNEKVGEEVRQVKDLWNSASWNLLRTVRPVLNQMGRSGKQLVKWMDEIDEASDLRAGAIMSEYKRLTKGLSNESKTKIARSLDGFQEVSLTEREQNVSQALRKVFDDFAEEAEVVGVKDFAPLEGYFPHYIKPKFFQTERMWKSAIAHLLDTGQAADEDAAKLLLRGYFGKQRGKTVGSLEKHREL